MTGNSVGLCWPIVCYIVCYIAYVIVLCKFRVVRKYNRKLRIVDIDYLADESSSLHTPSIALNELINEWAAEFVENFIISWHEEP